ncbi:MAG: CrcB family protein [Pseudanabaenaceae cyanobacterium SKYGB_i_bin29]|nr:CrcB family protein [Pseudanabaenaceae cyanobacterium SKYG29]MDW8420503.1 CrcB family protein [Pseudanabaenaceae cyanobacterium SKYGB_i_bin29]
MLNRPVVAIALGAISGSLCRYYLLKTIGHVPWNTLIVNTTGCFCLGLLVPLTMGRLDLRLTLIPGFLGSYTTFSSYELDSVKLLLARDFSQDLLYWGGSLILGYLSLHQGFNLGNYIRNKLQKQIDDN